MIFNTPELTSWLTWPQSCIIFEMYFPECLDSKVWISENKIELANFFCNSPDIFWPTLIIFNLAKYKERPFAAKAATIAIGINQAKVWSFSTNIFFTAGSKSHAVADVEPATSIDRIKQNKIV